MVVVEKLKLKSFRFKTDEEYNNELVAAKALAEIKDEDPDKVKVRKTEDIEVWARPLELGSTRRCIEFVASKPVFVVHSRDLKTILESQGWEVKDVRGKIESS